MLIASGTNIARYAGLLLGGRTILHDITNTSLRVYTSIAGYAGLLLGGRTILHGITNNSLRVDCFRNLYHRIPRVTARWEYNFVWHR